MPGGIQQTRPKNRREFMQTLQNPYVPDAGLIESVFTEPQKLGQPEFNRAYEYSLKNDTDKVFSIGIKDIDDAVMYYFNNILKLSVNQNNSKITIPILYGTPENWKSVQSDGYYRDQKGKLMAPLLMFKRNSITQNRNLGNKLDGNKSRNIQYFQKAYTQRNNYSNFNALNSRSPETEYIAAIIPDYVTVEYECIVWTYFVEQMDGIIESLNFASRSYWGDPNRFLFYSAIETFNDTISYDLGDDRLVRNSFNLTLNGYLIPDTDMSKIAGASRAFGLTKVIFGLETTSGTETATSRAAAAAASGVKSALVKDSINNVYNITNNSGVDVAVVHYLAINTQIAATVITDNTAQFNGIFAVAPAGLPPTSIDNFSFFINGTFIEKSSIVSFTTDDISTSTLVVDTTTLGYTLSNTDIILAIGKFA